MTAGMSERYRAVCRHPAGVAIITADDGGEPVGLTATSVISVSDDPATLAFSLSRASSSAPRIARAETVVVHLLAAGQVGLAKTFATGGIDRFEECGGWRRMTTGEPFLSGVDSWLRGRITNRFGVGGASVVILDVLDVEPGRDPGPPLVYQNRTWYSLDEAAVVA